MPSRRAVRLTTCQTETGYPQASSQSHFPDYDRPLVNVDTVHLDTSDTSQTLHTTQHQTRRELRQITKEQGMQSEKAVRALVRGTLFHHPAQ
jgi:hypothetical protein